MTLKGILISPQSVVTWPPTPRSPGSLRFLRPRLGPLRWIWHSSMPCGLILRTEDGEFFSRKPLGNWNKDATKRDILRIFLGYSEDIHRIFRRYLAEMELKEMNQDEAATFFSIPTSVLGLFARMNQQKHRNLNQFIPRCGRFDSPSGSNLWRWKVKGIFCP